MLLVAREVNDWLKDMSWLSKRDKLDPVQSSAIDFVAAQKGNFYVSGEAGTENVCRAGASSNDGII